MNHPADTSNIPIVEAKLLRPSDADKVHQMPIKPNTCTRDKLRSFAVYHGSSEDCIRYEFQMKINRAQINSCPDALRISPGAAEYSE